MPINTMERETDFIFDVLESIGEMENVDTLDLPPLGEVIDTDALITLLNGEAEIVTTFDYCGYAIQVDSDGRVSIE